MEGTCGTNSSRIPVVGDVGERRPETGADASQVGDRIRSVIIVGVGIRRTISPTRDVVAVVETPPMSSTDVDVAMSAATPVIRVSARS